jgi:uncharacterized protein
MARPAARQAILTALAWLCLTCASAAQTLVFPALSGRVVDEAGLLTPTDRASLTESLTNLETKTTDQVVVVTLKSLQGTSIEDYGYQLGRAWKIGQKDKDSGALLIVAPTERKVRIEVGYGLEDTLTDALTKIIIERAILPKFKEGDFAGGIKSGTNEIIKVLTDDAATSTGGAAQASAARTTNTDMPGWLVIVLGLAGVGILIFCAVHGGQLCRGLFQIIYLMLLFGRGGSSGNRSSFSGGGGSFGGGGSSGSW